MKTLLSLILTIAFTFDFAFGQYHHFPDSNAVWSVYNQKYFVSGDSIINLMSYKKYHFSNDSIPTLSNSTFFALLREDVLLKKIFAIAKDNNSERLLYDFSLGVNDTITVFPLSFFHFISSGIKIKIDQIDSIIINGQYRKRLKIVGVDENTYYPEYWIEGIGSTFGPFNSGITGRVICDIYYPELLCFEQDGLLLYDNPNYLDCFEPYPTGINENKILYDVRIYPNPTQNIINIESDSKIIRYRLISSIGQVIVCRNIFGNTHSIDITGYPTGTYLLFIETDKRIAIRKIIKNDL